jgi:NAD(P)-dependent dehydrogenase (short-subunit alcohol dehydrogenase family)
MPRLLEVVGTQALLEFAPCIRQRKAMDAIEGRTAFITGGARGIGLGIARAFHAAGARVALADVDADALAAAKTSLAAGSAPAGDASVETVVLDVRDRDAFARAADQVEARIGPVSLLFNNAGIAGFAPVTRLTYAAWDWVLDINVGGVVNGIQTFLPRILQRGGGGHIVNTASGAGLAATASGMLYTTSKFAVVGLSEALRIELEPFAIGVSVLCPGPVRTRIIDNTLANRPDGALAPTTPEEAAMHEAAMRQASAFLDAGTRPERVGEMVLAGVKDNQPYIHTDRIMEQLIKTRTEALLASLP